MSLKLFQQLDHLENLAFLEAQKLFNTLQDARVIHDENWNPPVNYLFPDEESSDRFNPARDYSFSNHELTLDGLRLCGSKYVGGGEFYHVRITIPLDQVDDIPGFIKRKRSFYAEKAANLLKNRHNYLLEQAKEVEISERAQFERLKSKYMKEDNE